MTLLNNNLNTFKLNILNTSHRELTNKINMIGLDFSNFYIYIRPKTKKKICVFPIDPKMLTLTLTFFMPKKNRSAKSGNSSLFPCLFPNSKIDAWLLRYWRNFLHFLVHLIDVWNQKHCIACQIINKL
jgi:hypothetical protein